MYIARNINKKQINVCLQSAPVKFSLILIGYFFHLLATFEEFYLQSFDWILTLLVLLVKSWVVFNHQLVLWQNVNLSRCINRCHVYTGFTQGLVALTLSCPKHQTSNYCLSLPASCFQKLLYSRNCTIGHVFGKPFVTCLFVFLSKNLQEGRLAWNQGLKSATLISRSEKDMDPLTQRREIFILLLWTVFCFGFGRRDGKHSSNLFTYRTRSFFF